MFIWNVIWNVVNKETISAGKNFLNYYQIPN